MLGPNHLFNLYFMNKCIKCKFVSENELVCCRWRLYDFLINVLAVPYTKVSIILQSWSAWKITVRESAYFKIYWNAAFISQCHFIQFVYYVVSKRIERSKRLFLIFNYAPVELVFRNFIMNIIRKNECNENI